MSPAENKRAKRRKNKKGRLSNSTQATKSNEFNELPPVDDMPEIDISEIKDRFCQGSDMRNSASSSEKIICIKCHRPQTNSDLKKSSSKLGEYSAGLLEGFRVSRDLHLCDEKKIELGIPDPLFLCEECENCLLPPDNKVTYSYRRHNIRQPHSLLRVETEMVREGESDYGSTFETPIDNPSEMVSLMGAPVANLSSAMVSGACLCTACCERKQVENEEEEECRELKRGWLDIKAYLHKVYREEGLYLNERHSSSSSGASGGRKSLLEYLSQSLTKKKKATPSPSIETLKEWVHRLCKQDPQHFFVCLESQVKLFVNDMRCRLLSLLKHINDSYKISSDCAGEGNGLGEELEEDDGERQGNSDLAMALKAGLQSKFPNNHDGDIFLHWVCHEYQSLCAASRRMAPILEELEVTHLKNFNLTWELVNRHIFRSIVYSDSSLLLKIQRCCLHCSCTLHSNIEQKLSQKASHVCSPLNGSSGTHGGVECPTLARFSKLDDEMTVINVVYREAMNLMEEFNKRQWKMMEREVLNKKNAFAKAFYQKSLLQCQNNNSETTPTTTDHNLQLPSNNLNLPNAGGGNKNCKNTGILNLNDDALIKLAMTSNEPLSGSSSNCSSSPSSCSSESSSASSVLSLGSNVELQQGEDLKLLLQEITKLNSSEILPKQVTDLLINSAGLATSQSSGSSIPASVPSNSPDIPSMFSGNAKCELAPPSSTQGCLHHKHRGDISPSFFSSQRKNPRSDINSFRRNEYLNLYNPVKIKSTLPLHTTQSVLEKCKDTPLDSNSSCECHDCLVQKYPTFNLRPTMDNNSSSSSSVSSSNSSAPPPVGSYPLLPNHLSEIARSAASHLASKALIHPHLYNLHARKAAKTNSTVVLEANKKPCLDFGQSPITGGVTNHQASPGNGASNSIDFELVAKEVFREQVKLAAQGISNNQANAGSNLTPLIPSSSPNGSGCVQSKNFFAPVQPRSRSSSSGDISNTLCTSSPTTSHNVGTQSDALSPGGSPLKTTQGTSCAMGAPANSNNIPSGKTRGVANSSAETLKVNGNSKTTSVIEPSVKNTSSTVSQRDQIVMTEGTASVAVGTAGPPSECQMTGRHNHHHHHHSRDQCCESVMPPNGGNYVEGDESGLDDSCSERSSSTSTSNPRESRVCDCCYCEVFGHGVPVVAPVSRNYPEMRERLRLRLSKRKAEGSTGSSKTTTQHLSNSPSSNLPENLPLATDKNNHGKILTRSADDRELDDLLRYINGTDLDQEGEDTHLHEDHHHGCSGNCRKPVNGTTKVSSTKAANKKQRKKAKKAIGDEKNVEKKESVSPPIRETLHANRGIGSRESLHRETKKHRSASPPLENRVSVDVNNVTLMTNSPKPKIKANRMSENVKGPRSNRALEEESAPVKEALASRAVANDENLCNSKNKSKLISQSQSKTLVLNHSVTDEVVLKEESSPKKISPSPRETVVEKEEQPVVVVTGPKKNSSRINGIVPVPVINNNINTQVRNVTNNTRSNAGPAPIRNKKNKKKKNCVEDSSSLDEVFLPKDIDLDNGELDEAEKELEAFKRFCMASVPLANKEKVHVNLKDIVIKKKVNNPNGNAATAP